MRNQGPGFLSLAILFDLAIGLAFAAGGSSQAMAADADVYAPYRARARAVIDAKDPLKAEALLMEMPDVNIREAVRTGETQLVELVALGDPDRLPRNMQNTDEQNYYYIAAQQHNTDMIRTLLRLGLGMPDSYDGIKQAAIYNDEELVRAFVEGGADINQSDRYWGGTALHQATYFGYKSLFDYLLDHGADVNVTTDYGWAALHAAAKSGRIDYAEKLLAHGARVDVAMKSGVAPVHQALAYGQREFALWLLDHGAKMDVHVAAGLGDLEAVKRMYPDPLKLDETMPGGPSPAFMAAQMNQVEVLKFFIDAGLDVNSHEQYGRTLLLQAANCGATDVVKYLLEQKADPLLGPGERQQERYATPLHAAAAGGHVETIRALLDHGVPVDLPAQYHATPLEVAAEQGNLEAVAFLLDRGAKVDGLGRGDSPLGEAIFRRKLDVCRLLLERGANPNGPQDSEGNPFGTLPLARAAMYRQKDIFELLLEHGANPQGVGNRSVLAQCVKSDPELIRRLIELGADVNAGDGTSESILCNAIDGGNVETVRMLLAHGAKANLEKDGYLAVHAGRLGDVEVMKALIDQGLELKDPSQSSSSYNGMRTALEGAIHYRHKGMVQFLISKGMNPRIFMRQYSNDPLLAEAAGAGAKLSVLVMLKAGAGELMDPPKEFGRREKVNPLASALKRAAAAGRVDTFRTLLREGAWNEDSETLQGIAEAADHGHAEIIQVLGKFLGRESMPELTDSLMRATSNLKVEVVRTLLAWGADPNATKKGHNSSPLHELAKSHYLSQYPERAMEIANLLTEQGAQLDLLDREHLTAAHIAVQANSFPLASLLVERGTPLEPQLAAALGELKFLQHEYAENGDFIIPHTLSLKKVDNAVEESSNDPFGNSTKVKTPPITGILAWAAAGGNAETITWLAGLKKFDLNGGEQEAPLLVALQFQQSEAVRALLKAGADANGNPAHQVTLIQAARWGDMNVVRLLFEYDVNVQQADAHGQTALNQAVKQHNLKLVKFLVEKKVPIDETNHGTTALEFAFRNDGHESREIALYLLDAGADPKAGRGESLYWEVRQGKYEMVERLLKAGVNPNRQTAEGRLPLCGAIDRYAQHRPRDPEGVRVIELLLKYGADPEVPEASVRTPLKYAQAYDYPEAVQLMRQAIVPR